MSPTPGPDSFRWGAASSALSGEGVAPTADWARWEQQGNAARSADGNGFFTNYADDFAAFAELGFTDVRITVEWARIAPRPGIVEAGALDQYRDMFATAAEAGLAPWATMVHTTLPGWFHDDEHGFREIRNIAKYWSPHVDRVAETLDGVAAGWTPIEDPVGMAMRGYLLGSRPPGRRDATEVRDAIEGGLLATFEADRLLTSGAAPVMPVFGVPEIHRADDDAADEASRWDRTFFDSWIGAVRTGALSLPDRAEHHDEQWADAFDIIGLHIGPPVTIDADGSFGPFPAGARTDGTGLAPHTDALAPTLHRVAEALPDRDIAITVGGVATDDDDWRHELLTDQVSTIHEAIRDGVPLVSAFFEPGIDGYEPATGFATPRGLLDRDRRPKPSAAWLFEQLRSAKNPPNEYP